MYETSNSRSYNGLGSWFGEVGQFTEPYAPYPGYSVDPTQVPISPGYPYGIPGMGYPGYAFGTRILELDDAMRMAKERQIALERRAETSEEASHKYLAPSRKLSPAQKALFSNIKAQKEAERRRISQKGAENTLVKTLLIGLLLSALLRG